ncbi:MAG: hypothetical protein OJF49_002288 [Ktedonobacterales bacterium]|jgi:SAM-dependent methyltransferase|nr:MAG: hypothetical protein OJF49_002288 [Ktedonobacterales bacterium]
MSLFGRTTHALHLERWFFTWRYLRGFTPWDTGISPPELVEAVAGPHALPPGRALDIGCGTGTNALYLARHGWQVTGIDFAAPAIARANRKLQSAKLPDRQVRFLRGDATAMQTLGLGEEYTLLFDLGCLHLIAPAGRARYAAGLAQVAAPGALYLVYVFAPHMRNGREIGITPDGVRALFAEHFTIEREVQGSDRLGVGSAWYWLRRM